MPGLFEDFNQFTTQNYIPRPITAGSLISFRYPRSMAITPGMIHDVRPMIIVSDIVVGKYIRGLNLHYITFPYVKKLLDKYSGVPTFNYQQNIKPDKYLTQAFRKYSWNGIQQPKRLDNEWLKFVLSTIRAFSPGEIEKIRASIQQQIQSRLQVKAENLTTYEQQRNAFPNQ